MGNTWSEEKGIFHGYDVEGNLCSWGAVPPGDGSASEGKVGGANLSGGWDQPQDGLQVVEAVYGSGSGRAAGPVATTAAGATANAQEVGGADSATAASAAALGPQEAAGGAAASLEERGAQRSNGGAMPAAAGDSANWAATPPTGVCIAPTRADGGTARQPCLDGGFQGVVSDWRGAASGSPDGEGPLQSVWVGGEGVAQSKLVGDASGVCKVVRAVGYAGADSGGQRKSIWINRAGGVVALERVVDASGDCGGVYPARASRTEQGARAVSSSAQARDDATGGAERAGPAASDDLLAKGLQPGATSRGIGATDSGGALSCERAGLSARAALGAVCGGLGGAAGAPERGDQVEGATPVHWGSLRRTACRAETAAVGGVGGVFLFAVDRAFARSRYRGHAAGSVCASEAQKVKGWWRGAAIAGNRLAAGTTGGLLPAEPWSSDSRRSPELHGSAGSERRVPKVRLNSNASHWQSVTHVLASKCYPCVATIPTPALSPSDGRGCPPGRVRGH